MRKNPATRVVRGWLAASLCTWTAFAAHAHQAPSKLSLVVMLLITCVCAVIAMAMLGRKFSLWATSLLVLLSQGLFHLSFSVMGHSEAGTLSALEHGTHHGSMELSGQILRHYAQTPNDSMLYAHVLAAVTSVVVLYGAERLLHGLRAVLTLRVARLLFFLMRCPVRPLRPSNGYFPRSFHLKRAQLNQLPARRGPPSFVLTA
ncbi:hypothetical protein [Glutamicibacter sp. NPDC087344]|uniref:hypothetical protein n=1 Tax=Glutamicibacter sp. NPDC087344 TaxID=3363994 RepID=UPI0037FDC272